MASFKFIAEALNYEIERQAESLDSGVEVTQQTRLFDEQKKITVPMRTKEDAPDYRYFPDPDLLEVEIDQEFLEQVKGSVPELPDQKVDRFVATYYLSRNDALLLTKEKNVSAFFEACAAQCEDTKKLSRWISKDLFRLLNEASVPMEECPVSPTDFARLIALITAGDLTENMARTVLQQMFESGQPPQAIMEEKGLQPVDQSDILEEILEEVMVEHPQAVAGIKAGNTGPIHFLVGQVMKKTEGRAHAKKVQGIIREKLLP
jgi:aspartyl-tRNA(Asn)/glutamyl-tRNA(Gln) amidotransferase subunit B